MVVLKPVAAAILALGVAMLPVHAQDRPPVAPARDVSVTYDIVGGPPQGTPGAGPGGGTMRMAWDVAGNRMRVDMAGGNSYIIVDRARKLGTMVMPQQRTYMEIVAGQMLQPGEIPDKDAKFTRGATETIAGLSCNVWNFESPDGAGSTCLTGDGVMLRANGQDGKGVRATAVKYGPVPAVEFTLPDGYRKLDLNTMMPPGQRPPNR
jgi:hypothetical protein